MAVVGTENISWSDLSDEELEDKIATLASHIYAGTCRWLELVAELDRRGGFAGCTVAEWLAWRCALSPRAAREHVRVARRLHELPLIHEAFARGELSYTKVRSLTRVATERNEEELLELARHLTASQLDRAVGAYRRVTAAEANEVEDLAYVGYSWDPDGSLVVRARLTPEQGALFVRGLEAARDSLRGPAGPRRPTSAEALGAMADLALARAGEGRPGGERYQLVVHVDEGALAGGGEATCVLEEGPALAPETAQRLACDASVVEIRERDGEPLSVGRKTRTIPPAMRRALQTRDSGCRFPGCDNRRFVDAHHIRHWAQGGETKLDNLVLLCGRHHRFLHEGGYSLHVLPEGGLEFCDPWGNPIDPVPRPPPGEPDSLVEANDYLAIDERSCECGDGDRMDLDLTVSAPTHGVAVVKNVSMSGGYVGILSVELHFPEAGSLKGKRKYVKSAKAQLQNRFGASVAEVDHHDLWQRARLTVACVAREHNEAEQLLEDAVRYLNGQEYELVSAEKQVVATDD